MPGPTLAGAAQALDTSLPTVYSEFNLLNDVGPVMRHCSTQMKLLKHEGSTKNINNYGRLSALALSDGVDYGQAQTLSDTTSSFSPSEVGILTVLSRQTMDRIQDPELAKRTGRILHNGIDLKEDTDGVNQLASFTATTIGAAGTVLAPGHLWASAARLGIGSNRTNPEPAPKPWYFVSNDLAIAPVGPKMMPLGPTANGANLYDTTNGLTMGVGARDFADFIMKEGLGSIGMLAGALVKPDANLIPDASDDVTGAFFSQEGLIEVMEVAATLDTDMPKRLRGGAEIMIFMSYVFGQYRPLNYGVPVTSDASSPTG